MKGRDGREEQQVGGQQGNKFGGLAKGSRIFPFERGRPKRAHWAPIPVIPRRHPRAELLAGEVPREKGRRAKCLKYQVLKLEGPRPDPGGQAGPCGRVQGVYTQALPAPAWPRSCSPAMWEGGSTVPQLQPPLAHLHMLGLSPESIL